MIRKSAILVAGLAGLTSTHVMALDPAAVPFGSMLVYPALGVGTKYDSNVYRLPTHELDDWALVVSPTILGELPHRDNMYTVLYKGEYAQYDQYSNVNYDDHLFRVGADWNLSHRSNLEILLDYKREHDEPASNDRSGAIGRLRGVDKWEASGASAVYTFGAEGAKGRIELAADYSEKRYLNHELFTYYSNVDEGRLRGRFWWQVQPKTRALVEIRYSDFDYINTPLQNGVPDTQDNQQTRYLFGVTWEALAKTTGRALIGYNDKQFDSDLREDGSDFSWEVGVEWRPQTYSKVDFSTGQDYIESTGEGDAINRKQAGVKWSHYWKPRFVTDISLSYEDRAYLNDPRRDERWRAGVGATYNMRRWLDFRAEYEYVDNSSNEPLEEYERNVFWLNMDVSL